MAGRAVRVIWEERRWRHLGAQAPRYGEWMERSNSRGGCRGFLVPALAGSLLKLISALEVSWDGPAEAGTTNPERRLVSSAHSPTLNSEESEH